jgi:hypothetical protein
MYYYRLNLRGKDDQTNRDQRSFDSEDGVASEELIAFKEHTRRKCFKAWSLDMPKYD